MKGGEIIYKIIGFAGKTALASAGALTGGGLGAALGTAVFPGLGTAIGYLFGIGYGAAIGFKAWGK